MRWFYLLPLGLLLGSGDGFADPGEGATALTESQKRAREVYRSAVAAQGEVRFEQVVEVHLLFRGAIVEEGTHTILREYWYRAKDRAFRIATQSTADSRRKTERGVAGTGEFWDRASGGAPAVLSPLNRDHRAIIRTITRERDDFEAMLRMVILSRFDDGKTRFEIDGESPVTLEHDLPYEASSILGKGDERKSLAYEVLRVEREGEAPLRLFIRTSDHSVRKAIVEEIDDPAAAPWHYYFGPFARNAGGLVVPRYLSAHKGAPVDAKSKERTSKARGELLAVDINPGLTDGDLRPG